MIVPQLWHATNIFLAWNSFFKYCVSSWASSTYNAGVNFAILSVLDFPQFLWSHETSTKFLVRSWLNFLIIGVAGHSGPPWINSKTGFVFETPFISMYWSTPLTFSKKEVSTGVCPVFDLEICAIAKPQLKKKAQKKRLCIIFFIGINSCRDYKNDLLIKCVNRIH